jgi:hypothetical protein
MQADVGASPSADMACAFEKTSASGPMPTSMYCDQASRLTSSCFNLMAASEPGRMVDRSAPMLACNSLRNVSARAASPAAFSSITRSSMLTAKVTPQALIGWMSQGASSSGRLVSSWVWSA